MEVTVYNNERSVPSSSYNYIVPISEVTMVSQVSNLLALAKNLHLKKPAAEKQFKANILKLINSFFLESGNESTCTALKQYGFVETAIALEFFAQFLEYHKRIFANYWKAKRDIFRDSVKSPDN